MPRKNRYWILEKHAGFLLGLMVFGVGFLIVGAYFNSVLISSIGGAVFGGSISSLIAKADAIEAQEATINLLEGSLTANFRSDEDKIRRYRRQWHAYYVTSVDYQYEWRHILLDFREPHALGTLKCVIGNPDKDGELMRYTVTGAFRDQRLVLFWKAEDSDEPCKVDIFPFMGESFHNVQYGFSFLRTWDGTDSLSPAIMSRRPIADEESAERIPDGEIAKKLTAQWTTECEKLLSVLPKPAS